MITIHELLNKIKWDKNLKPEEFVLAYYDRIEDRLEELPYTEIAEISGSDIIVEKNGEMATIPMHRIKMVKQGDKVIWKREI